MTTGQLAWPWFEPAHDLPRDRFAWLSELRAKYGNDPRRDPACPGCETFGLCAWHAVPVEERPRPGHARAKGPR